MLLSLLKQRIHLLFTLILSLIIYSANAQQENNGRLRLTPKEITSLQSKGSGAPGSSNLSAVQEIVIAGDPSKTGLYTIILKVAPNTKIPAHKHPDDRMATVISGTWYFGYGEHFDTNQLKKLPAGSIYSEVKAQNHFAMTGSQPVIVEINGYGPSGVTFFNPSDDPHKSH
jgi:quercetin dioxygenase-like cupin family protein